MSKYETITAHQGSKVPLTYCGKPFAFDPYEFFAVYETPSGLTCIISKAGAEVLVDQSVQEIVSLVNSMPPKRT